MKFEFFLVVMVDTWKGQSRGPGIFCLSGKPHQNYPTKCSMEKILGNIGFLGKNHETQGKIERI